MEPLDRSMCDTIRDTAVMTGEDCGALRGVPSRDPRPSGENDVRYDMGQARTTTRWRRVCAIGVAMGTPASVTIRSDVNVRGDSGQCEHRSERSDAGFR